MPVLQNGVKVDRCSADGWGMRVALISTFAASKKEPLGEVLARVHQAFLDTGLGEPAIRFNFGDPPLPGYVSSVDRVLKRHPLLERFVTSADPMPGIRGTRRISNGPMSAASGEFVPFETLQAIASGVPRSFPFHSVVFHLHSPEFGALVPTASTTPETMRGVLLGDNWWVNGRNRSMSACTVVEAEMTSKKLPPLPEKIAALLATCGKVKKTTQAPIPGEVTGPVPGVRLPSGHLVASANPEAAMAVRQVMVDYRNRLQDVIARAGLPHELPVSGEALRSMVGVTCGPRKPALERVFKPMGYSCRGGSGSFTLRRRTEGNLTAEVYMDVGTWGHSVLAMFKVYGMGYKATLSLPVAANVATPSQYPIGDSTQWEKIVENFGAMVRELEHSFVPDVLKAGGPAPEWYSPES